MAGSMKGDLMLQTTVNTSGGMFSRRPPKASASRNFGRRCGNQPVLREIIKRSFLSAWLVGVALNALPASAQSACPYALTTTPGTFSTPAEVGAADAGTCLIDDTYGQNDPLVQNGVARTPLILIHGINGNGTSLTTLDTSYFQYLISDLYARGPDFTSRYKIYRFHYVSNVYTVSQLGQSLRNWLDLFRKLDSHFDDNKMVIVTHSMGGLVARAYMNERNNDYGVYTSLRGGESVKTLITLATPHYGSPMANGEALINGQAVQGENPDIRLHGGIQLQWGTLLGIGDLAVWGIKGGCSQCEWNLNHPNRSDLRWAAFSDVSDVFANDVPDLYSTQYSEQNPWLQNLPKTYDFKIIAYYGSIGASIYGSEGPDILLPTGLTAAGVSYLDPFDPLADRVELEISGTVLERVYTNQFGITSPLTELYNDGAVPVQSGSYIAGQIAKRVACVSSNHTQMRNGDGGQCSDHVAGTTMSLFDTVFQDLQALVPPPGAAPTSPPGSLAIDPSGTYVFTTTAVGGTQAELFTVTNNGGSVLTLSSVGLTGSNASDFAVLSPPSFPLQLAASAQQALNVQFRPSSAGTRSATLNVGYTAGTTQGLSVALSGTGGASATCTYSLSAYAQSAVAGGGNWSFTVSAGAGCGWTVGTNNSFVTVLSPASGSGTATEAVSFNVTQNYGLLRSATITVQGGSQSVPFVVTQDASGAYTCTTELSPSTQSLSASSGTGIFSILTPSTCGWSVTSSSPWLLVGTTGLHFASGSVGYSWAANTTPNLRVGTLAVTGDAGTTYFTASQAPGSSSCSYSISPSQNQYIYQGGFTYFNVSAGSGCSWTASSTDSWITIQSGSYGTAAGQVQFNIAANPANAQRIGSINVQGGGQTLTFTVNQLAGPSYYPTVSLPTSSFNLGQVLVGGTAYQTVTVKNTGNGVLYVGSISLLSGTSEFAPPASMSSVLPSNTGYFTITLTPTSSGTKSATFVMTTNDPSNSTIQVSVTATAVPTGSGGIDFVWTDQGTVPETLAGGSYLTTGSDIYIYGNHEWRFDPTVPSWTSIDVPTIDPQYGGAVLINGGVYLTSGFGGQVAIDQLSNGNWTSAPSMQVTQQGAVVVTVNGKLYVIGGYVSGSPSAVVEQFDPATNLWTYRTSMPTARGFAAGAVVNNMIYVIGGLNGQYLSVTEAYDPSTDTWTTRESMPTPRESCAVTVLQNKIEVIGGIGYPPLGQSGLQTLANVEEFDPSKPDGRFGLLNAWAIRNPISSPRYGASAAMVNNTVYVIGGMNTSTNASVPNIEVGTLSAAPVVDMPIQAVAFGDVPLSNISGRTIIIQNLGNALLTLTQNGGTITGNYPNGFTLLNFPSSVPVGGSVMLRFRFAPTSVGAQTGNLIIGTNDPNTASITMAFSGNGTTAPSLPAGSSFAEVSTINLPSKPYFGTFANATLYVTSSSSAGVPELLVVDPGSGTVQATVSFDSYPTAAAGRPVVANGYAYVPLNMYTSGQLAVVSIATNTVSRYIAIGDNEIWAATFSKYVYLASTDCFVNGTPSPVQVVDTTTNSVTASMLGSRSNSDLAVDPITGTGYATGGNSCPGGSPQTFDGNTNSVIGSVSTTYPTQGVAIMGSHSYILESGLVDVVDIESNAIVDSVPVYPYVQHIATTPHYVFVGTSLASAPGAYVLDPTTNLVVAYIADSDLGQLVSDPQSDTVYVLGQFTNAIRVLQFREPNFSVSCAGGSASSAPGTTAPVGCTLLGSDGYTGSVGLTCTGLPAGASCGFTPSTVNLGTVGSIVVAGTITVPPSIVPGVYPFDVQAADGLLVRATTFSLVVPTCSFVLTPQSTSFGASGGASSAGVAATTGCSWAAQSTAAWLKITSGSPGNGNGSTGFSADPNGSAPRTATVTIGDQNFTVTEAGSQSISPCDLKQNGSINVADVQLIINEALGVTQPINDLNGDGVVNVLDVQIEINAALGLGCGAKSGSSLAALVKSDTPREAGGLMSDRRSLAGTSKAENALQITTSRRWNSLELAESTGLQHTLGGLARLLESWAAAKTAGLQV